MSKECGSSGISGGVRAHNMDTKNYNKATKFFRDMQLADAYDNRWGKFADAMDEVISTCVPVVRCSDCKHWIGGGIDDKDNFIPPKCSILNRIAPYDWFCADGERKDDES